MPSSDPLAALAATCLERWPLPDHAAATLINVSENATYRVDATNSGRRWALRIHREGYHSPTAIASELAWAKALRDAGAVTTPTALPGRDGGLLQVVTHRSVPRPRVAVLFEWETGTEPAATDVGGFAMLGETAARMHEHALKWQRPPWFDRHTWDFDSSIGARPHWGFWRDGMGLAPTTEALFARPAHLIRERLVRYGFGPQKFGLVHGDMRLSNILVDGPCVKIIDFDDCGFSWYLYDCATTVSFFEHKPEVPQLLAAWVEGYRRVRTLSALDEAEIPTFVMLRRLLLVAWIGSHSDTDLARSMGIAFTAETVPLCERYLTQMAI